MMASIDITEADDGSVEIADDENDTSTPMDEDDERLVISIDDKLSLVTKRFKNTLEEKAYYSCITRVPKHLRDVNEKSYEPQIIAIGPYHRHPHIKPHLEAMEELKVRYLKELFCRTGGNNLKRYVMAMKILEERARACYADVVKLNKNDFAEMLLLDACFIVELLRRDKGELIANRDDPVMHSYWIKQKLRRDLLLAENQLPFFVLLKFCQMTGIPDQKHFRQMIFEFFEDSLPNRSWGYNSQVNDNQIRHLLSFVYNHWASPVKEASPVRHLPTFVYNHWASAICSRKKRYDCKVIRCATELNEAGIKFMMVEQNSLFDINFEGGIMKIPRLKIEDDTESFFRNLIVYEQSHATVSVIVDYVKLMDCLIDTPKDVELLWRKEILHTCLGDDEVVANMFNRLCDSLTLSSHSRYETIYSNVSRHCGRRQNKWMANLRHNYFNTPWACISFIAAALLLILTAIQTVFTVLAYFHH